jgi:hypothetical protein
MTGMPLFTFVLEFDGGTYIAQFRAASLDRAVKEYAPHLLRNKGVASRAVRERLSEALSADNPVSIKGVRNVWCCSASVGKKLALLNVVVTAVPREPDKDENTLNETVTVYLPKSACLVLYELLAKSYRHWRKSNPGDSSPNPMQLNAKGYAQRRAVWQLEGALERAVPELFASDSAVLLKASKRLLVGR